MVQAEMNEMLQYSQGLHFIFITAYKKGKRFLYCDHKMTSLFAVY